MVSWFFLPHTSPTLADDEVAAALQALMEAGSADELEQVMETWSAVFRSPSIFAVLYLTIVREEHDGHPEVAQELRSYLYFMRYAQVYDPMQAVQRLISLDDAEINAVFPLTTLDWVEPLIQVQEHLSKDDFPQLYASLCQELGDLQVQIFDQTQDEDWLERAYSHYSIVLSLLTPQDEPVRRAYIYMQRGIVSLHRQKGGHADHIEDAIANLETALTIILPVDEPQMRGRISMSLGQCYRQREHDQREKNLRRAIEAYNASLLDLTSALAPQEHNDILYSIGSIYIELQEAQPARAAFADLRTALQDQEQLARALLQDEATSPPCTNPHDGETIAATLKSWLEIYNRDLLHAFLIEHQDILVSDEALIALQDICAGLEATNQDGRFEYLTSLVHILENALAFSVEIAWQRYLIEILPALTSVLLLSIEPSFQAVQRRIAEEQELFNSPTMLAIIYSIAQSGDSEIHAQQMRALIVILKRLRSDALPFPIPEMRPDTQPELDTQPGPTTPASQGDEDGSGAKPIITPKNLADIDMNDPFFKLIMEDMTRLSPEQRNALMPYFGLMGGALNSSQTAEVGKIMRQVIGLLVPQQTPYLWATFLMGSMQDPQVDQLQILAHCDSLLPVLNRETVPTGWVMVMVIRGIAHATIGIDTTAHHLSAAERHHHFQQCISDLSAADAFYTLQAKPFEWALVRSTRAMAVFEEQQISRQPYDIEQVLADFDAVMPIMTRQGSIWQQTNLHIYRARVLYEYQGSDQRAKFERVIEDCNAAIILAQSRALSNLWAYALSLRGVAYTHRIDGGPSENLEQAIKDLTMALSIYTRSTDLEGWAVAMTNRAYAYMQRVQGDKAENLNQSLKDYSEALSGLQTQASDNAPLIGKTLLNRSICYMEHKTGNRGRNQRLALDDCKEALELFTRIGLRHELGVVLSNRASIYMQLLAGDPATNLKLALADSNAAMEIFSVAETPLEWAKTLSNRGLIQSRLAWSLAFKERGAGMRTQMQRMLSSHPESMTNFLEETTQLIERALADFSAALTVLTRESMPLDWARVLRERAMTYAFQASGYFSGQLEDNIRRAIFDYDAALTVFSHQETPYDWALTIANRGTLYAEVASKEHLHDAEHALADLEEAQKVFTRQVAPTNYCRLQNVRARIFVMLEQWTLAHEALLAMREAQRDLVASAPGSQEQTDIIAEFALIDIYTQDAWIMLHIKPVDDGAVAIALEEGRARSQRIALDLDDIHLERMPQGEPRERMTTFLNARNQWRKMQHHTLYQQGSGQGQQSVYAAYNAFVRARERIRELDNADFMTPVPTRKSIANSLHTSDEALVYLVAASSLTLAGGMALIVTRDLEEHTHFQHMFLPRLDDHMLLDLMMIETGKTPMIRVSEAIDTLGRAGLNDVANSLLEKRIRKARLVPYGWLGLFPLSTVLISTYDGQRCHMNDLFEEVTIVPGARNLEIAHTRSRSYARQRRTLLIAGNPKPHFKGSGLPSAEVEAATIKQIAEKHGYAGTHIRHLLPREITRHRVIEELQLARYAHLALHGQYRVGDPRRSRLVMAGTEKLEEQERSIYLGEVLDGVIDLHGMRLLLLSACETSIIDMQRVPNEALGIAAGFLQAGAAAVIASLWAVEDTATYLLMTHFAQLYLDPQGLWSPARALAAAQRWLRTEATNSLLATFDPTLVQNTLSARRMLRLSYDEVISNIQSLARIEISDGKPDALPYSDPFFWAGFVTIGV